MNIILLDLKFLIGEHLLIGTETVKTVFIEIKLNSHLLNSPFSVMKSLKICLNSSSFALDCMINKRS